MLTRRQLLTRSAAALAATAIIPAAATSQLLDFDPEPQQVADWLPCDGRAVRRDHYGKLFDAIGETYGRGDGITTFNVPNMTTNRAGSHSHTLQDGSPLLSGPHTHSITFSDTPPLQYVIRTRPHDFAPVGCVMLRST